jgi:hypothetical protein
MNSLGRNAFEAAEQVMRYVKSTGWNALRAVQPVRHGEAERGAAASEVFVGLGNDDANNNNTTNTRTHDAARGVSDAYIRDRALQGKEIEVSKADRTEQRSRRSGERS